ncbi:MmyB family transcriptional regulator [Nocardia takedensis]|uniref:MmyB family transcriptional regulator n=1 Tax=Nocardia takedensis TaxID=259390 RepID=UPI003F75723B
MARNGQRSEDLPLLARYLREYRDRKGYSRAQVAARGHLSASLLEKWELEGAIPSRDKLEAWFAALRVPPRYREKIISLTTPELYRYDTGPWPAVATTDDVRHLEHLPDPACYQQMPVYDLIAANAAFYRLFPGLQPPAPGHGPTNIIEWQLLHPAARRSIRNWYQRTHEMLSDFRIMAPGCAPQGRIDDIITECRAAPEFNRMWSTDPADHDQTDPTVTILDKSTETWIDYSARSFRLEYPRRPFDLYHLVPKEQPTPEVLTPTT